MPLLSGSRLARRIGSRYETVLNGEKRAQTENRIPLLLVGTGTSCDLYLRALRNTSDTEYRPIGIVDSVEDSKGLFFHDIPIVGSVRDIDAVADWCTRKEMPRQIVLTEAPSQFDQKAIKSLVEWAEGRGIAIRKLAGLCETFELEEAQPLKTLEVAPDDLLQRPARMCDHHRMARLISGARVVVTGAGGSIGSELARQIAANGPESLLLLDHSEYNLYSVTKDLAHYFPEVDRHSEICDIRDKERVERFFQQHKPDIVFNAAALKHVPIVEKNPCQGVLTNVVGTRNVAEAALRVNAKAMVQISTDKAVNASSVMGATKRVAELYCAGLDREARESDTRFMTVRFGNVLGSSGSLIPLFKEQIACGGPLTVTDPRMERFFMTIREAVELTLMASANGVERQTDKGSIFVLDMGEPIKIIDLAERMIRLSGMEPGRDIAIKIIGTRPGEKLFEELFDKLETRSACGIDGVLSAASASVSLAELRRWADRLEAFARLQDRPMVLRTLQDIVPGYGESADEIENAPRRNDLPPEEAKAVPLSNRHFADAPKGPFSIGADLLRNKIVVRH
ncbi:nucleoside-diphosphate sugar epimerase/dehydratase [Roseivivax sp. THAF40]|nr:nucleoside-diphosphate sugar epimerase/dehydratase [Roseivivax sp. THAF40]